MKKFNFIKGVTFHIVGQGKTMPGKVKPGHAFAKVTMCIAL